VCAQRRLVCDRLFRRRLRPDHVSCTEAQLVIRVQSLERALWQTQLIVENANDYVIDFQRLADERAQDNLHHSYRRSWVRCVHDLRKCERVVLGDTEVLRLTNSLRQVTNAAARIGLTGYRPPRSCQCSYI
jgi:hypothetical protein